MKKTLLIAAWLLSQCVMLEAQGKPGKIVGIPHAAGPETLASGPGAPKQAALPFALEGAQKLEYRFTVEKPGSISVDVRWKGSPLTVSLTGGGATRILRQGITRQRIRHRVTRNEIARSVIWTVSLTAESRDPAARANGKITIAHPAGETAALREQFRLFSAEQRDKRNVSLGRLTREMSEVFARRSSELAADSSSKGQILAALRCPKWNDPTEAAFRTASEIDGFNCTTQPIPLLNMTHYGGIFTGTTDADQYFPSYRLKNGWVVDSIAFAAVASREGEAEASIVSRPAGGGVAPSVRVGWWVTPGDSVHYVVLIMVRGPEGSWYE